MASSSLSTLSLFLISFSCFIAFSSSRRSLIDRHHTNPTRSGLRLSLHHVDFGKNLTKFEKIQRGINRGSHRLNRLGAMAVMSLTSLPDDTHNNIEAPTHSGSGEFLMELSIGSPPVKHSAIVDTGSDLIWTQCEPCTECFEQEAPIFDPRLSSSFSEVGCSSELCTALPKSRCIEDKSACEYLYVYGDYSSTIGILAMETFTFEGNKKVPGIGFGCGLANNGDGFSQGSGLVGLGRGPLSLISQLNETIFSYCLTSRDDIEASSSLFIGSLSSNMVIKTGVTRDGELIKTTPLLRNPNQPSLYYLALEGITVGSKRLPIANSTFELSENGTGGMIIDSGTTITYLEEKAFKALKEEFPTWMTLPVDDSGLSGLDLCFTLPYVAKNIAVPKLIFHFKDADLELPRENYMVADPRTGVLCLAMGSSRGMSVFGNVQQQNFNVLHDLEKETVTFVPTDCGKL